MTTLSRAAKLAGIAVAALAAAATALAALAAFDASRAPSLLGPVDAAIVVFSYTVLFGGPAVLFIGVPFYYWLEVRSWNSTPRTVALGAAPGIAALPFDVSAATVSIACGIAIALATHAWASTHRSS